jgi:hypothetical protein
MGTISKEIADDVIQGMYNDDDPVAIIRYTNSFNGEFSYGLICEGDRLNMYTESQFVIKPQLYWDDNRLYSDKQKHNLHKIYPSKV